MNATEAAKQAKKLRTETLAAIRALLPKDQKYVNFFVPFCAGIKLLRPDGALGLYGADRDQLEPRYIENLPIDSLVSLLQQLEERAAQAATR